MSKFLKVTLASVMLIAGPTLVFAETPGAHDGRTPNGTDAGVGAKSRSSEQDQKLLLDDMNTGSISNCDSQTFDQYGNCVASPDVQEVR